MTDLTFIICVFVAHWSGIAFGYLMLARGRAAKQEAIIRMEGALMWIMNHTPDESVHHIVARDALKGKAND